MSEQKSVVERKGHFCGECAWWIREGYAFWGRCAPVRHNAPGITIGDVRPPCPAFSSRSAAANQAKFIEAVKRLLWEIHDTEADKVFVFQEATSAVEAALKEMER